MAGSTSVQDLRHQAEQSVRSGIVDFTVFHLQGERGEIVQRFAVYVPADLLRVCSGALSAELCDALHQIKGVAARPHIRAPHMLMVDVQGYAIDHADLRTNGPQNKFHGMPFEVCAAIQYTLLMHFSRRPHA